MVGRSWSPSERHERIFGVHEIGILRSFKSAIVDPKQPL